MSAGKLHPLQSHSARLFRYFGSHRPKRSVPLASPLRKCTLRTFQTIYDLVPEIQNPHNSSDFLPFVLARPSESPLFLLSFTQTVKQGTHLPDESKAVHLVVGSTRPRVPRQFKPLGTLPRSIDPRLSPLLDM